MLRPASARAPRASRGSAVARALFAVGLLLPLLGGGNVLFVLEPIDAMRYLGLVAVCAWWLLARRAADEDVAGGRALSVAAACLLVLGVWWIGELALRASGPRAFLEAQGLFAGILLFAGLSRCALRKAEIVALVDGLVAGSLVTVAYSQYQYWVVFPRLMPVFAAAHVPAIDLVNANFYNANCYAVFLSATLVLGAGSVRDHPDRALRRLIMVAIAALAATVLLSESRSTIGLLLLAGTILLAIARAGAALRRHWRFLAWTAAAAIAALAATVAAVDVSEFWHVGLLGRFAIWQGSVAMIRDHWLVGVGLGRFWDYFPSYRINTYYTRYPHNFLLEIFAELGIVALAAMVGFLAAAFARPLRLLVSLAAADRPRSPLPAAIVLAAMLLFTHALLDIDWHAPANSILLFVLLGAAQRLGEPSGAES